MDNSDQQTERALQLLEELHESFNWNTIARIIIDIDQGYENRWYLWQKYGIGLTDARMLEMLCFYDVKRLRSPVRKFIIQHLQDQQRLFLLKKAV